MPVSHRSKLVVLLVAALGALDRVLLCIQLDLGLRCLDRVDAKHVAQLNEIEQDIRNLSTDGIEFLRSKVSAFCFGHPLKVLKQFASLHDEGRGQVLGGMKLFPFPLLRKFELLLGEVSERICHGAWAGKMTRYDIADQRDPISVYRWHCE